MAGIGFALRKMTQRDDLMGTVQAYGLSALLAAGPWLFTIIAITIITLVGQQVTAWENMLVFRGVITYNFSFSLVFSGPIIIVATRFISDQIFAKDTSRAPGVLICAMGTYAAIATVPGIWYYGFVTDMTPFERVGSITGLYMIGFIWIATLFVSALKDYSTVAWIFFAGMLTAIVACVSLGALYGSGGLIHGFNAGLAVIFFALVARVFAEYPFRILEPFALLGYIKKYWPLAASGLAYNIGIWCDKWMMWIFDPNAEITAGAMRTLPFYDSAMFLAYLITVPGMALFFVSVETEFFEQYRLFYGAFQEHANLKRIRELQDGIASFVAYSLRNMAIFLSCIGVLCVISAAAWFDNLGITFNQIGVYRLGTVGAIFHTLFLFEMVFLSYFDLRSLVLRMNVVFLVGNVGFTALTLIGGFPYYGFGYLLAAATAFFIGLWVVFKNIQKLDYSAFIVSNPSIRR